MWFGGDGGFRYVAPGRDDRPEEATGAWRWDPGRPGRITATADGQHIELCIDSGAEEWPRLRWLHH